MSVWEKLWEKIKKFFEEAEFYIKETYNIFCQQLADFVTIQEKRNQVEATCGKKIAVCFHDDALRIAKTISAKEVDIYCKLADKCIEMFLDGKSNGKSDGELQCEIIFYFSSPESYNSTEKWMKGL